jgi:hypothetical protein
MFPVGVAKKKTRRTGKKKQIKAALGVDWAEKKKGALGFYRQEKCNKNK